MDIEFSVEQIAGLVKASAVEGHAAQAICGIAGLSQAQPGDLSFLGNKKYTPEVPGCRATAILLPPDYQGSPADGQAFIRVANPSFALASLCTEIECRMRPEPPAGVHPTAVVAESATIDPTATIGPHCVVGEGAEIGPETLLEAQVCVGREAKIGACCVLKPHVTVADHSVLGDRVTLHSGVVVGSDGFGYETINGVHEKVPQIGNVVVENDVEIGANTTIDRARFSSTRIGAGTKIDNLVQIAHNVEIGKGCILVAQAGIGGSTILEDYVVVAGQVGIAGHLRLAKGTVIAAKSGLHNNTRPGDVLRGIPAIEAKLAHKSDVLKKRLPELFKRVAKLEDDMKSGG